MTWVKGQDFGFKVGQRAWHTRKGWGTIVSVDYLHGFAIGWRADDSEHTFRFMKDGCEFMDSLYPSIFHVEQTFDFSRPKWQPEPGQLVWCWTHGANFPNVRKFVQFYDDSGYSCSNMVGDFVTIYNYVAPFDGKLPDEFKHLGGGSK